jgi:hypothetical protein
MAQLAYILSGAAPVMKKFQYGVTLTAVGIPFTIPATDTAGVVIGTTTGATDLVGFSLDQGLDKTGAAQSTYTTTQGTGASSAERMVTLIINPDAAWRFLMSGGATDNTTLATQTVTTASSTGVAVTTAAEWSNPTYDEGYVWGLTGANAGQARKITSVSSTAGTVTIPFDYAIAVGDTFLRCPFTPMQGATVQLTTALTQANAIIAVATGAPLRPIELILRDASDSGATNSYVIAISNSHALNLA